MGKWIIIHSPGIITPNPKQSWTKSCILHIRLQCWYCEISKICIGLWRYNDVMTWKVFVRGIIGSSFTGRFTPQSARNLDILSLFVVSLNSLFNTQSSLHGFNINSSDFIILINEHSLPMVYFQPPLREGAVELVVLAMKNHPRDLDVLRCGCQALSGITGAVTAMVKREVYDAGRWRNT